jgi:hypothetical protein
MEALALAVDDTVKAETDAVTTAINNPPRISLRKSANQTIPNAALTDVTWETEVIDSHAMHSTGAGVTIAESGTYLVVAQVVWSTSSTGARLLSLVVNEIELERDSISGGVTPDPVNKMTTWLHLTAGDVVKIKVYQTSGAGLGIIYGGGITNLECRFKVIRLCD